jgi:hypothetical protein
MSVQELRPQGYLHVLGERPQHPIHSQEEPTFTGKRLQEPLDLAKATAK